MKKNKKIENEEILNEIPYYSGNDDYSTPNLIVRSKYKTSLLEHKLYNIALQRISTEGIKKEENGHYVATIKATEISELIGDKSRNVYKKLNVAADNLSQFQICMINPEKEEFAYYNLIDNATYKDHELKIQFGSILEEQKKNVKAGYTIYNIGVILSFKSVYSARLYEQLKTYDYDPKNSTKNKNDIHGHKKEYSNLTELKIDLGIIDANNSKIKQVMANKKKIDYDKIAKIAEDLNEKASSTSDRVSKYNLWKDLKKIIDAAVAEINQKTELNITYQTTKSGKGGKVTGITFFIANDQVINKYLEKNNNEVDIVEAELDIDTLIDRVHDIFDEKITTKDCKNLLKEYDNDTAEISKRYRELKDYYANKGQQIDNIVGLLISANKNNYQAPVKAAKRGRKKKNMIERDDYDFAQLELDLTEN